MATINLTIAEAAMVYEASQTAHPVNKGKTKAQRVNDTGLVKFTRYDSGAVVPTTRNLQLTDALAVTVA
jgi:hypothetical protein